MDFDFPNIKKRCPLCGGEGCARWKGYYSRQALVPEVDYMGKVAIHVGHCPRLSKDFSYLPSFLVPHRRLSREGFRLFCHCVFQSGIVSEAVAKLESQFSHEILISLSTAYYWLMTVVIWTRLNHESLGLAPDLRGLSCLKGTLWTQIEPVFSGLRFVPGFELIVPPD